ncbi:MAG: hypothetical protein WD139_13185, partial [Balneolaceae bacterium]
MTRNIFGEVTTVHSKKYHAFRAWLSVNPDMVFLEMWSDADMTRNIFGEVTTVHSKKYHVFSGTISC